MGTTIKRKFCLTTAIIAINRRDPVVVRSKGGWSEAIPINRIREHEIVISANGLAVVRAEDRSIYGLLTVTPGIWAKASTIFS